MVFLGYFISVFQNGPGSIGADFEETFRASEVGKPIQDETSMNHQCKLENDA